eukprot:scaffold2360_cov380-Prasinococcus_capsulatus_cf.AAC.16
MGHDDTSARAPRGPTMPEPRPEPASPSKPPVGRRTPDSPLQELPVQAELSPQAPAPERR